MNIEESYDAWAEQYDTNKNKTRELEAISLREMLAGKRFDNCLEIGCGTGKNTEWLVTTCGQVTAVDLSNEMLAIARQKVQANNVSFIKADINDHLMLDSSSFDLVTFSLVLEHIENISAVFEKISKLTRPGALVYIGELHPFKQYTGTKARFETKAGRQEVTCFNHHISEFYEAGVRHGFTLNGLKEYFDNIDNKELPRILTILFSKK